MFCSVPLIVTEPVADVAGVVTALFSDPLSETEPLPAVAGDPAVDCSLPFMVAVPDPATAAGPAGVDATRILPRWSGWP